MDRDVRDILKKIPAVDKLLIHRELESVSISYPRSLILKAIHHVLEELRLKVKQYGSAIESHELNEDSVARSILRKLELLSMPNLKHLINGTGVVIHTNLGRSILPESAVKRLVSTAGSYNNLEYDLASGTRGSRHSHVEEILIELTGAEAAMVVNNNAAAVLVALDTIARGREIIVSRGELVEIGGSFRIPDVMKKSGAIMVEVGTTNKTHIKDYEEVINQETALLLKVHTSNFQIVGFTGEVTLKEMVTLGNKYGIPVMEDLGSGCFIDFSEYEIKGEPTVQKIIQDGVDIVTFSGDKLLGGPQAGIILGRKDLIDKISKNQLSRALRIDKLTLLALEETLRLYRDKRTVVEKIPTLRMLCEPLESLKIKAAHLLKLLDNLNTGNFSIEITEGNSKTGGGSLPLLELPSCLLNLVPKKMPVTLMEKWLRNYDTPIITRVEKERILIDLRTVQEYEYDTLVNALKKMAKEDETIKISKKF